MQLAIKELKKEKNKYMLIVGILILMVFMVLFLSGLANGLSRATSAVIEDSSAQFYAVSEDSDNLITRSQVTKEQLEEILTMTESPVSTLNLQRMTIRKSEADGKLDITYMAVDANGKMMPKVTEGSSLAQGKDTIVLDASFKSEGITIGSIVYDATTGLSFEVTGFAKDVSYAHSSIGIISVESFTKLRTMINENYQEQYHAVAIHGNDAANIQLDGVTVVSKADIIKSIPGHAQEQMTINMILWVLVVVSAVILGVFFYVITIQKLPQFGVLKALGMTMGNLSGIVVVQVLFLSVISAVIGNALTFGMAMMLPNSMPFSLSIPSAVLVTGVFVVISVLCGLLSLQKIRKVDPIMTIGGKE